MQYPANFFTLQPQTPQATQNWMPSYFVQAAGQAPQEVSQPRIPLANNADDKIP